MAGEILIDLPEFGDIDDWKEALAELQSLNSDARDVQEAILRCQQEIAELSADADQLPAAERWNDHSFTISD